MILRLRLWFAKRKMAMLINEIVDTADDHADALLANDVQTTWALREYSFDLCRERTRLADHIKTLQRQLKDKR